MKRTATIFLCLMAAMLHAPRASGQECEGILRGCLMLSSDPDFADCPNPSYYSYYDIYGSLIVSETCDAQGARFRVDIPQDIIISYTYGDPHILTIVGDSITVGVELFFTECIQGGETVSLFHIQMLRTGTDPFLVEYRPHRDGGLGIYSCEPGSILFQPCPSKISVNGECLMSFFCDCDFVVPVENDTWGAIKSLAR